VLKVRVIPTLLWKEFGLVKGVGFDSWRRVGTMMPAIKVYNTRQVDELIVLDITATFEGRVPDYESINEFSAECFVPLTVGGGVRNLEDIKNLLRAGADKISINSAAYDNPHLIREAADKYGSQCIVVSIDAQKTAGGNYESISHCGTRSTGKPVDSWAREVEALGAGEILLTSIERDGTMQGYDLDLINSVTRNAGIPVIASGGAGSYQDMYEAISVANCSAVAAASIFHFTQQTPMEAKKFLSANRIAVRNVNVEKAPY
jgi:cyclase